MESKKTQTETLMYILNTLINISSDKFLLMSAIKNYQSKRPLVITCIK